MNSQATEGTIIDEKPSLIANQLPKQKINLPLDVTTELSEYKKFYITKGKDFFRIICCCEDMLSEYNIYAEMPDGDKKLLFTCTQHYICCCCGCSDCCPEYCKGCPCFCFCCGYVCSDKILFQMNYKRNNRCFYTQGISLPKGCYCGKCICYGCCSCCCCNSYLDLKEGTNPKLPSLGESKGHTKVKNCCCCCCDDCNCKQCNDLKVTYISQEGKKGPTVRSPSSCCCKNCCKCDDCCCCCSCDCCNFDVELDIEDSQGVKKGNILIYEGCCSSKVEKKCCYCPRHYFDINMPPDFTSEEKFQVIADIIHFDLNYRIV